MTVSTSVTGRCWPNSVAGPDGTTAVHITVTLDGAAVTASNRVPDLSAAGIDVGGRQLYHLLTGLSGATRHLLDITVPAGLRLYTFTFG